MITSISTLESALVSYLTPLLPWAASVTGASDPRHADEEQYGILGKFVAVPAVVVSCGDSSQGDTVTIPVYRVSVTVSVRHSELRSLISTHKAHAEAVGALLWDISAMTTALEGSLIVSSYFVTGEAFTRNNRALETTFTLSITISGKE